ncbi:AraC-like DNA-binding protein [Azospirillum fermentarium]|uniref:helix-turn-helix transcriptional regulator n=1 Tax=Azospirillum fermentarium TaxID=1233114 RepID=UPI002226D3FE|nr:AraC family transcriptional regulator [Azospirillum fermentarium]MCW2244847.1 AraC-like DNA-binding protein [Azospirillum fermentarium]
MERIVSVRPGIGATASILQGRELRLARVVVDQPTLIVVACGRKRLVNGGGEWVLDSGGAVVVAGGQAFDVINTPGADGGYRASWLVFDARVLARYGAERPEVPAVSAAVALPRLEPDFLDAYGRAVAAVTAGDALPAPVAEQRLREVLAWLGLYGARPACAPGGSVAARVRDLFAADPARGWTAADAARHLAMSEPTMRRRLAEEGQSASRILIDVRMHRALMLLQSTDAPVTRIAFDVGYDSPSRFAVRFRERFGHSPTAIRAGVLESVE